MTKIIEYAAFALLLALFVYLVVRSEQEEERSREWAFATEEPTESPYATAAIIEKHLQNIGYRWDRELGVLIGKEEAIFPFSMEEDWLGILNLKIEASFHRINDADDPIQIELKRQNVSTRSELAAMLEAIFPDLGGTIADVEPFLQKADAALEDGVSRHTVFDYYEVRVLVSDSTDLRTVTIEVRDISH